MHDDPTLNSSVPDGANTDFEDADSMSAIDADVWEDSDDKLTIDSFPHGSPGAPIPGVLRGQSEYQSRTIENASPWVPFQSQDNWDIALWAKTPGPSSTALTELLQYHKVRVNYYRIFSLTCHGRLSISLDSHMALQENSIRSSILYLVNHHSSPGTLPLEEKH